MEATLKYSENIPGIFLKNLEISWNFVSPEMWEPWKDSSPTVLWIKCDIHQDVSETEYTCYLQILTEQWKLLSMYQQMMYNGFWIQWVIDEEIFIDGATSGSDFFKKQLL